MDSEITDQRSCRDCTLIDLGIIEKRPCDSRRKIWQATLTCLLITVGTGIILILTLGVAFMAMPIALKPLRSRNLSPENHGDDNNSGIAAWSHNASYSVAPVRCHSHNDYSRPYPLFSALVAGCVSVEADVWLADGGDDLWVGHHRYDLSPKRTLRALYIDPITSILDSINPSSATAEGGWRKGVFRTQPSQTLFLFVDIKDNATATWPIVERQLQPLRERGYLTRLTGNGSSEYTQMVGPVTVVGTGNIIPASKEVIGGGCSALAESNDMFLDAPLDQLADEEKYGYLDDCQSESFLGLPLVKYFTASSSMARSVGFIHAGFSSNQLDRLRRAIRAARSRNLTSRYWSTPSWPISLRDHVWQVLVDEGVGLLNADDVESAARWEWNRAYGAEIIWIIVSCSCMIAITGLILWQSVL